MNVLLQAVLVPLTCCAMTNPHPALAAAECAHRASSDFAPQSTEPRVPLGGALSPSTHEGRGPGSSKASTDPLVWAGIRPDAAAVERLWVGLPLPRRTRQGGVDHHPRGPGCSQCSSTTGRRRRGRPVQLRGCAAGCGRAVSSMLRCCAGASVPLPSDLLRLPAAGLQLVSCSPTRPDSQCSTLDTVPDCGTVPAECIPALSSYFAHA